MTRRERMEAKAEKRREWAEGRRAKSDAAFKAVRLIADNIPLGQPILIGHHSEKHARRDQEKIHNGMTRALESRDMAKMHDSKASELERRLEACIFSDDPDAIEALEARAAELDAEADQENAINKAWRKGKGAANWADSLGLSPEKVAKLNRTMALCPYLKGPCFTTNTRANARRLRERIKTIKYREARSAEAEAAGGVLIRRNAEWGQCSVIFAEKPERFIIDALKAAGFCWGGGSWGGQTDRLPACVLEIENANQEARA